jgi:hypothetical protein
MYPSRPDLYPTLRRPPTGWCCFHFSSRFSLPTSIYLIIFSSHLSFSLRRRLLVVVVIPSYLLKAFVSLCAAAAKPTAETVRLPFIFSAGCHLEVPVDHRHIRAPIMASIALPALSLILQRDPRSDLKCTVETCDINTSYYFYRVSLGANATLLALFSISCLAYILTYAFTRRATAFTVAMLSGVILEILGYVGRIMSWKNQWDDNGFLMQIVCLTIAPAFMAGGIYLCLRRIVYAFGPENSRIAPESYTRIVSFCS